jgi:hypothetical protein
LEERHEFVGHRQKSMGHFCPVGKYLPWRKKPTWHCLCIASALEPFVEVSLKFVQGVSKIETEFHRRQPAR